MTGRDIRLIAVDLDGTLLNDRKEVPPDFIPMVEALYPRGIRFVLASGRQYYNLAAMVEPVADKLFYFAENGGLIFDGADIISCSPIPDDMQRLRIPEVSIHQQDTAASRQPPLALQPVRPTATHY